MNIHSVQFSRSVMSDSLWPQELQHARPPCPTPTLRAHPNSCPSWCPLSSPSPPAPNPSQHHGLFKRVSSLHDVAKVLELQLHHQSFQWTPRTDLFSDGLVGSPCSPRDSQESSPTPQFKSINSSALSFLQISFWNACCCFLSVIFLKPSQSCCCCCCCCNLLILSLVQKNLPCASYSVLLG